MNAIQEIGITTQVLPASGNTFCMLVEQATTAPEMLVLYGQSAPWIIDAARKLEVIGRLPTNWDSYGGLPLDLGAKTLTVSAMGWLGRSDLPVPAVVLGSSGTVQVEWRVDGRELEIELGKDGIGFLKVYQTGEAEEGTENVNLPSKLQGLTWWLLHG